ncbi:Nucleoid-associated protein YejK [Thalassocella blandensis]|nr:Nucleoid-associated protein YejK [Thalassocella blandensis]
MPFTHLIAHRIERGSPSSPSNVTLRSDEIPLDGRSEEFARELKQAYIKKLGKIFGRFTDDIGSCPLPAWLTQHLEEKSTFASFSQQFVKHFVSALDNSEEVASGYLVFAYEKLEGTDTLFLFWLMSSTAQQFDNDFDLSLVSFLDVNGITLAARLNIAEWQSGDSNSYLGFLPWRGEKDFSDVLLNAIGFTDKRDCKAETEAFLEVVDAYTSNEPEEKAPETRAKVVEYCLEQDKLGKPVEIKELSAFVDEDDHKRFAAFVTKEKPEFKQPLIPDKAQLRNYIRISGRNELMSMSFASNCLGETVVYDPDNDSLTIKNIPSALKSRLLKHLQKP